jgi:putative aldouronate transport system permease protein
MVGRISLGRWIFLCLNTLFLLGLSFICLAPFIHVLSASVSDPVLLLRSQGLLLWPKGFTLKGYELVVRNPNITNGFRNTLFYVTAGTALNILLTSMGAYVCSRKGFAFSRFVILMITFTMFFNGGLIPFYILVRGLGMVDTPWALILPPAISAFNLIIMRTAFSEIPPSLEESARIDGANDFTILFRIVIPVSKAVVAVMVLLYSVGHWNSWFTAMIFLRERKLYPLQLVLREILIQNDTNKITSIANAGNSLDIYKPLIKYSTIITSIVPIMCIYPFIQKYFVSGIMIGSLKG